MPDEPIFVHSAWAHFIKDFIFSFSLIILGVVVMLVNVAKTALYYSVTRVFIFLEAKLNVEAVYHIDLNEHISEMVTLYIPITLFVMALLVNFSILYRKKFTWLALSTDGVVKKYGFPIRWKKEVKYVNMRTVENWQGGLDKLFRIGDVLIASGGSQGYDIEMNGIKDPDDVAATIRNRQKAARPGKLSGVTQKYDYF
ncbi:MAG: PH domain-containing protein [Nitrospinota bacterium]|nr:PH domain-containing protein [Nitrospinota bacterium]